MAESRARWRLTPGGLVAAGVGLALFWFSIRRAGVAEIVDAIGRLGGGFAIVMALSAVRELARAGAWMLCIEPPHRLRLSEALPARLTGEALGNLTPLGLLISEPAKAVYVRQHLPLPEALAGLAVETLFYSLTVVFVIVTGMAALLVAFPVPEPLKTVSIVSLLAMAGTGAVMTSLMAFRPTLMSNVLAWSHDRGLAPRLIGGQIGRMRLVEERVYGFFMRHPRRLLPLCAADATFHLAGIAEVYVTLAFITGTPELTWLTAFVLEAVNRVVTVVFKFVPLRLGVDEAASGIVATVLRIGAAPGVALAIVRKARVLCWSAVGIALLIHRGLSIRRVLTETQELGQLAPGAPTRAATEAPPAAG